MNPIVVVVIAAAVFILGMLCGISIYFFKFTFERKPQKDIEGFMDDRFEIIPECGKEMYITGRKWLESADKQPLEIKSRDGLTLRGEFIENPNARGIVAMFHGYRSIPQADFTAALKDVYDLGYSLFLANQRACGASEGKYITFGVNERYDCVDWIEELNCRYGAETPIFLDGISMGAATVLAATDLSLPANVRGVIADCGYTSPSEILTHVMRRWFKLRRFPFYYTVALIVKLKLKFGFKDFSTEDVMTRCNIPIFFAHGEDDDFVPYKMSVRNYEACAAPKRFFSAKGAGHGEAYLIDPDGYKKALEEFLEVYG